MQKGWILFTADVSQALLRGLTFEEAAKHNHEVVRTVQFTVPPGSLGILQQVPGFETFNPFKEVLNMLRCGFGLKGAPILWAKVLQSLLERIGL